MTPVFLTTQNNLCSSPDLVEFRDADDLNKVILLHSATPHQPGSLCAASPTVLFYEEYGSNPREVRCLDCSTKSPKPLKRRNITHTQQGDILDMSSVDEGDKQLLVTVNSDIQVYDTGDDKLLWKVEGRLTGMEEDMNVRGVTSDGCGHLYVSDVNNECIQMFRASDGKYLGCLIREGEQALGVPYRVRWRENLSSLVVLHDKNDVYYVEVIEVKQK